MAFEIVTVSSSANSGLGPRPTDVEIVGSGYAYSPDRETFQIYILWGGTAKGVDLYYEPEDQGDPSNAFVLGDTLGDGTKTLNADWNIAGPFSCSSSPATLIPLPAVTKPTDIRVYAPSYSDTRHNPCVRYGTAGASPSVVVTVYPPGQGGVQGEGVTLGAEQAGLVSDFAVVPEIVQIGGVSQTRLTINMTLPGDRIPTTVEIWAMWPGMTLFRVGSVQQSGDHLFISTPSKSVTATFFALSAKGSDVNTYLAGFSPSCSASLGAPGGLTLDLAQAFNYGTDEFQKNTLPDGTVVLAIKQIAVQKLVAFDAAFASAVIANLAANTIQTGQINGLTAFFDTLYAGKVYAGTIQCSQITSGTLDPVRIPNLSVSKITGWGGADIEVTGMQVFKNGGIRVDNSPWSIVIYQGVMSSSNGSITAHLDYTGLSVNNTRVVGSQKASVSAPSGGTTVDSQARTAINDIINRLQAHGLIA